MTNYKLYDVFETLTKVEIRQFRQFLRSPFFNKRSDLEVIFEYLAKLKKKGTPLPDKSILFQKAYIGEDFNDLKIRAAMSDLQELIEEFLLVNFHRKDALKTKLTLCEIYRTRQLSKHFIKTEKKAQNLLSQTSNQNVDYYQHLLSLQTELAHFHTSNKRSEPLNLQEVSNTIDHLYLLQKLRHSCTQLTHQKVYKTSYDHGLLHHVLERIEAEGYLTEPLIAIYYYCYQFLTNPNQSHFFQQFKTSLLQYQAVIDKQEQKQLHYMAINFCIRKINEGDSSFVEESFDLYQYGLSSGILLENNLLSRFTFNNIIGGSIKLNRLKWSDDFIEAHQNKLDKTYRESTICFNRGRIEYARKNYREAIHFFQKAAYEDLINILIIKSHLLKIYFELKEFDVLDSHLQSFSAFIRRRKVSDFHRKNFLNFIQLVRKLTTIPSYDKARKEKLKKEANQKDILTERKWFLSELERW